MMVKAACEAYIRGKHDKDTRSTPGTIQTTTFEQRTHLRGHRLVLHHLLEVGLNTKISWKHIRKGARALAVEIPDDFEWGRDCLVGTEFPLRLSPPRHFHRHYRLLITYFAYSNFYGNEIERVMNEIDSSTQVRSGVTG